MPTYVYACDTCGKQFEQFQSFKDAPLTTCPCEQQSCAIRRVFQPVGVVFKGAGWYITDSRRSSSATVSSDTNTKDDKGEKPANASASTTPSASESSPASDSTD